MLQLKILLFTLFLLLGTTHAFFSNIPRWLNFNFDNNSTSAKNISAMTLEELGTSRGQCTYDFLEFVLHREREKCAIDDHNILHLQQQPRNSGSVTRKPPIMVKCLQAQSWANTTNTGMKNWLLVVESVKDVVTLLKPIGNATKRHEPGSCVLIFFHTDSCLSCMEYVPKVNLLPWQFPSLRVAAIDALRFPSFNTEFGIVGLPTLLLFHQGRPIVKYYRDMKKYSAFVRRHTGIQPVNVIQPANVNINSKRVSGMLIPLPLKHVRRPDYVLFLAWTFILLCLGNYFAKSQLCKQIVEMVKRNWREAQMEHN